ncbi:MAG TPA: hypothetical protein VFG83_15870 [Kofleriaceae bacterium]|nr:hypothetical protein [Kofleriaceae bacterium]
MAQAAVDVAQEYRAYVARFDQALGAVAVGSFVKHRNRLIKKLSYEEFSPKFHEYADMAGAYYDSIERGDTINDVVVKLLRDFADELILPAPA